MNKRTFFVSEEELDMFIEYLWQEELEHRLESNGVLKELHEMYQKKELNNEQN